MVPALKRLLGIAIIASAKPQKLKIALKSIPTIVQRIRTAEPIAEFP
jgi:hypothetical protein